MSEKELELLSRIEELERHTWRNSAILRAVAMVSFTALIGIVVASGVVGGGRHRPPKEASCFRSTLIHRATAVPKSAFC